MRKERKHYTGEEKVAILRRHLLDKVPVSDLCDELGLQPTVLYRWQKEFFENGAAAFEQKAQPNQELIFDPRATRDTTRDSTKKPVKDHVTPYFTRFASDPNYGLHLMRPPRL